MRPFLAEEEDPGTAEQVGKRTRAAEQERVQEQLAHCFQEQTNFFHATPSTVLLQFARFADAEIQPHEETPKLACTSLKITHDRQVKHIDWSDYITLGGARQMVLQRGH